MTDEPEFDDVDPWIRFDMWAERAREFISEAIDIERSRGDNTETCALTDILDHAAYVSWSLASAAAPEHKTTRNLNGVQR